MSNIKIFPRLGFSYNIKKFITPITSYDSFKKYFEIYYKEIKEDYFIVVDRLCRVDFIILAEFFHKLQEEKMETVIDIEIENNQEVLDTPFEKHEGLWGQYQIDDVIIYLTTKSNEDLENN